MLGRTKQMCVLLGLVFFIHCALVTLTRGLPASKNDQLHLWRTSQLQEGSRRSTDLTKKDDQDLEKVFSLFDSDGDGFINAAELKVVMTSLGDELTDEEIAVLIERVDIDGDGLINYEEFQRLMALKASSG